MTMTALLALTLAPASPLPLTDIQQRDLGCVATLGIIAQEQNIPSKQAASQYPDLRKRGKIWTGKVGVRIMEESGQPREVIALAIKEAVYAIQEQAGKTSDPHGFVADKVAVCVAEMDRQLAAPVAAPAPVIATTDDPGAIALYRAQLGDDLADPRRIRGCQAMVKSAYAEIVAREGAESRDAMAFALLLKGFEAKSQNMPVGKPAEPATAEDLLKVKKLPSPEAQMARCLRLGESLALALPPE